MIHERGEEEEEEEVTAVGRRWALSGGRRDRVVKGGRRRG